MSNLEATSTAFSPMGLLAEAMAAALGDLRSLGGYQSCLLKYPLPLIALAFRQALYLPQEQVRKSRGAYFMHLLKTLSSSLNQGQNPS